MTVVVCNYDNGTIDIIKYVPDEEDFESFVYEKLNYKSESISWMAINNKLPINIYHWDSMQKRKVYTNEKLI